MTSAIPSFMRVVAWLSIVVPFNQPIEVWRGTSASPEQRPPWRSIPVRKSSFTEAEFDSTITARSDSVNKVRVLYVFDNPCTDSVSTRARRMHDTLDVRFDIISPTGLGEMTHPPFAGLTCPSAITKIGYAATMSGVKPGVYVVRGFVGNRRDTRLVVSRSVEVR
jgi:hypothetical protein